jgi:hypothetical protein
MQAGDGFFVAGLEKVKLRTRDLIASPSLGRIKRAVGAREKCVRSFVRTQRGKAG